NIAGVAWEKLCIFYFEFIPRDTVSHEASGDYEEIMAGTPSVDENLIASIIKRYGKHWLQKIRSFRIGLSFPPRLVKQCFSFFGNQFMQIRQTPNILFLTPT
ncbi:hypothetical protein D7V90_21510, partial [bacterium 1xD42-87]